MFFSLGYIDLSKRRVSPEDIVKCEERYNKSKMVHSILRHVAEKTKTPIEELYQSIGWPLNKRYGHAVDAFKLSITFVLSPLHVSTARSPRYVYTEIRMCGTRLRFQTMSSATNSPPTLGSVLLHNRQRSVRTLK